MCFLYCFVLSLWLCAFSVATCFLCCYVLSLLLRAFSVATCFLCCYVLSLLLRAFSVATCFLCGYVLSLLLRAFSVATCFLCCYVLSLLLCAFSVASPSIWDEFPIRLGVSFIVMAKVGFWLGLLLRLWLICTRYNRCTTGNLYTRQPMHNHYSCLIFTTTNSFICCGFVILNKLEMA